MNELDLLKQLAGKKILLVGLEIKKSQFSKRLSQAGATIETFNNKHVNSKRLIALVRSCDIVIIAKNYVNHANSCCAIEWAKKWNRAFDSFSGFGYSAFFRAIIRAETKRRVATSA
jgi:hypothetical protein